LTLRLTGAIVAQSEARRPAAAGESNAADVFGSLALVAAMLALLGFTLAALAARR